MNRIIFKVMQRSLTFQYFVCNSTLRAFQIKPVLNSRSFTKSCSLLQQKNNETNASKTNTQSAQKKYKLSPKITLIDQNQALSVVSLEEAQKLAKRRDLHLVLLQELDTKTHRPVYRLATAAQMIAEELEEVTFEKDKSAQKRSEKKVTIGSRISEHDLASRLKNISKWLAKNSEVHLLIQGTSDDLTSAEQIVKTIETYIKEPQIIGKIVQKRVKGQVIRFSILPVAPAPQA